MLDSLHSLFADAVIWTAVMGVGRPAARWLKLPADHPLDEHIWSAALGLLGMGGLFLLLGSAGLLGPAVVGLLTLAAAFWGLGELFCLAWQVGRIAPVAAGCSTRCPALWIRRAAQAATGPASLNWLAVASSLAMLVAALGPVCAPSAAAETLAASRQFASGWPESMTGLPARSLADAWFYWAWVLDGPAAAGALQWTLGLLAAGATALLARELLGARTAAGPAAAIFLLLPSVQRELGVPTADLAAAVFAALSWVAWNRSQVGRKTTGGDETARQPLGWLAMTALMLTAAASLLPGAALPLVAGLAVHAVCLRTSRFELPVASRLVFAAACALAVLVVVGRAVLGSPLCSRHAVVELGVALPALVLACGGLCRQRCVGPIAAALACAIATGSGAASARWWFPLLPGAVLLAACAWREFARFARPARWAALAAVWLMLAVGLRLPAGAAGEKLPVVLGRETRDAYLLRHNPEFSAVMLANQIVPAEGQLLVDQRLNAYVHCRTTDAARYGQALAELQLAPHEVVERLRASGITHVLLAQPAAGEPAANVRPITAALESVPADQRVLPLADFRLTRQDASVWRYRLIQVR